MHYKIVIPTRMTSTRLPGKALASIEGKPLIWHVYQRALETGINPKNIIIATDSPQIKHQAERFGAKVVMTSTTHPSGTDRIAEVVTQLEWDNSTVIVNLQGDEPLIPAKALKLVAYSLLKQPQAGMATLSTPFQSLDEIYNPNCVKVICNEFSHAIYFSRALLPYPREGITFADLQSNHTPFRRHIGVYAYRADIIKQLHTLPSCPLEHYERLEQLRALFYGITIQVTEISSPLIHGIDTPEDLIRIRKLFANQAQIVT
ncbi:3-deoxy-manno-octulosonate cytidylyltransferase [Shewanella surugensis]|uniref:8-amino-3,8-dideoxy-manno-octulosonate cytidylyltransferase n=1 Tax=Shewanella surugensis TaxID=212020 RepID=A0ABT0LGL5_9GAMM|nr:3-deoxy-manno-octulosonate cytidylyltransferase [Shewanella surugensis]MCL1126847.1 3-deoxy-manno-octulosonate cytidylyltransferase [Shewanella surugensis]